MNIFSKAAKGVTKIAKNTEKAVVKGAKDTGNASLKAVKDTGHVAGAAIKSDVGQALLGTALAASGLGLPAAVAVGASAKAGATLIAKGGNLKRAGAAAVTGAELGAGAAVVGATVRTINNKTGLGGFRSQLLGGKNATVPVSPARPHIRPISDAPVPVEMVPVTASGITPPSMKVMPVEQIVAAVGKPAGRKGTPTDTHKHSLPQDAGPAFPATDGSGTVGPDKAPSAFSPAMAIAAVGAAILVGMFASRRSAA